MKIHEYQARQLFREYGIPVTDDVLCYTVREVEKAAREMNRMVVVKAQVLVGGRGKAGGVKLARTPEDAVSAAKQILGMDIKGCKVEKVLVADAINITKEFYVGLINDRNTKTVTLMASSEGGVEIEEVAKISPEKIIKFHINSLTGLLDYQARDVALQLFDDIKLAQKAASIFTKLYKLYVATDATIAEINPMVLTPDNEVLAIDGKMNFDDNALFRQPKILAMREPDEDELVEIDANSKGLSYIRLDGNIGCMVNGAGLAMATMDMIQLAGGKPANDKHVKAVMINIFGGITRCDDVAKGLLKAMEVISTDIPIVVRLSGTNAVEGLEILKHSNLPTVSSMSEAAQKAIELSRK